MDICDAAFYLTSEKNKTTNIELKEALEMGVCALSSGSITQCCSCKKYILKINAIEDDYGEDYCKKCDKVLKDKKKSFIDSM